MKQINHNLVQLHSLEIFLFDTLLEDKIHYFVYKNISSQDTLVDVISDELRLILGENSEIFE